MARALSLIVSMLASACTFGWVAPTTMEGSVSLSGLAFNGEQRASASTTSVRVGIALTYYARLSLYGERLVARGWQVEGVDLDPMDISLFGAGFAFPVLLPLALQVDARRCEDTLARVLEVGVGVAGSGEAMARYVALGLTIDAGVAFHVQAIHQSVEIDVAGDLVAGQAQLSGWALMLGISAPGDIRTVVRALDRLSLLH